MADSSFIHPLTVTLYDLDLRDEVSCATLFRYFEETAIRGSAHLNFTLDWYRARNQFWVIRTLQLERTCAPGYKDALEIRTWVSSMARVRSDRNYEVRRAGDAKIMARAIANWVYVDGAQMLPTRIHPDITAVFEPHEPPVLPPIGKVTLHPQSAALFEHTTTRRAQFYEADSAQHTNNAVYVDWVEEAVRDALRALGFQLALDGSSPFPWFYKHNLEYARAAVPGDAIQIRTRLMSAGKTRGAWELELGNAVTGEQFLRAQTTMLWVNATGVPVRWEWTVNR